MLSDAQKRASYDRFGKEGVAEGAGDFGGFRSAEDIFKEVFGGGDMADILRQAFGDDDGGFGGGFGGGFSDMFGGMGGGTTSTNFFSSSSSFGMGAAGGFSMSTETTIRNGQVRPSATGKHVHCMLTERSSPRGGAAGHPDHSTHGRRTDGDNRAGGNAGRGARRASASEQLRARRASLELLGFQRGGGPSWRPARASWGASTQHCWGPDSGWLGSNLTPPLVPAMRAHLTLFRQGEMDHEWEYGADEDLGLQVPPGAPAPPRRCGACTRSDTRGTVTVAHQTCEPSVTCGACGAAGGD